MIKIILAVYLLSVLLYLAYTYIKKQKPYKSIIIATVFISISALILTTITYLF